MSEWLVQTFRGNTVAEVVPIGEDEPAHCTGTPDCWCEPDGWLELDDGRWQLCWRHHPECRMIVHAPSTEGFK